MAFPTIKTGGGVSNQVIAPNLPQFARGVPATFEVGFFDDAPANTTPSVPSNPSLYPTYTVVDPNGVEMITAVATAGSSPGFWQFTWNVPSNAVLSTQSNKWLVIWNMTTVTGRQSQRTNPFDVVELRTPETIEDLRGHAYLTRPGSSKRLILRLPSPPDSLVVTGYPAVNLGSPVPSDVPAFTGSLASSTVTEIQEQNLYAYVFDTPALTQLGEYQIVWDVRQTPTSEGDSIIQKLFVPPPVFFSLNPSLKTLIDKLQKKQSSIHQYNDADTYEYFLRGIGILNGVSPVTNWDWCSFPFNPMTTRYLIEAAALWALNAQHILAGELQFSFSGQTVTLDVDHTALYSEITQKLLDDLTGDGKGAWPATKVGYFRATGPIAHVANRMMGKTQSQQYTYKMHSGSIGSGSAPLFQGQFPGNGVGTGFTLTDVLVYLNLV
jgi:hypothetical protein